MVGTGLSGHRDTGSGGTALTSAKSPYGDRRDSCPTWYAVPVDLYTFSSKNLTNIWAGVGAGMWAIPPSEKMHAALAGKARLVPVGAFGVLYCAETQSLTTPFVIYSRPDPDTRVQDVWPETWAFPFSIRPLGTPRRHLSKGSVMAELDLARSHHSTNISHVLNLSPVQVLSPVRISAGDWELVLGALIA
jgi:hypothetical protein